MGRPIGDTEYPRPEPKPPHPAIAELIKLLPSAGSRFSAEDRVLWLRAMVAVLALVYPTDEQRESTVAIKIIAGSPEPAQD